LAVVSSSAAQLCIKGAAGRLVSVGGLVLFGISGLLMATSMIVAVCVLRTLSLSQLVPFAAAAYILVPLGGRWVFRENLLPSFWFGVAAIIVGVLFATL
jgi:undecaprenyl phosphate-alpha-L-ara4N flippase subunit ArnE